MISLLPYQKEYSNYIKPKFIYDMDTGTGKTYMGLFHYLKYYVDKPLLIIAPASKINEGGWQRTIAKELPHIKYETLSYNMLPKKWSKYVGYFVIYDECHRIKNSTGVWGKAGYNLSKVASGFILLSATPVPNGWEDAINYFKMFGLTKNKTQFLKLNAIMGFSDYGYLEIHGWKNETKLKNMWKGISRRLNKDEAVDLPPIVFKEAHFKASKQYLNIASERVYEDEEYDNPMKLRHGLRQHCNLQDKIQYLKDFLEDTTDNVIIFYNYDVELELLKNITDKTVYVCNGHEKNYPKQDDWSNIKNTVTLANYKSGSEAIEFTYGTIIIYFSPSDSYTEFYQSYGRCHRVGQTQKVTAYKFITNGTIEEDIYKAIDHKQDFNFDLWLSERGAK